MAPFLPFGRNHPGEPGANPARFDPLGHGVTIPLAGLQVDQVDLKPWGFQYGLAMACLVMFTAPSSLKKHENAYFLAVLP